MGGVLRYPILSPSAESRPTLQGSQRSDNRRGTIDATAYTRDPDLPSKCLIDNL